MQLLYDKRLRVLTEGSLLFYIFFCQLYGFFQQFKKFNIIVKYQISDILFFNNILKIAGLVKSLKGRITLSPDFDQPLEDFEDYMP